MGYVIVYRLNKAGQLANDGIGTASRYAPVANTSLIDDDYAYSLYPKELCDSYEIKDVPKTNSLVLISPVINGKVMDESLSMPRYLGQINNTYPASNEIYVKILYDVTNGRACNSRIIEFSLDGKSKSYVFTADFDSEIEKSYEKSKRLLEKYHQILNELGVQYNNLPDHIPSIIADEQIRKIYKILFY